ncbi:GNAT family N-acetyltransferase [Viridibacillus sp. YIM B01967]|uniref:GNAT family N-acetyltransferase n=2 Tax=Viridibacillus soli TaxID=2798301 RepID=A0ABS1H496_9BACL|nr:GNAT family N-acetyltransferase [Viridibacillus soli]
MGELGYKTTKAEMSERLAKVSRHPDYYTFVAEIDNHVVGLLGLHIGIAYEFNGCYGRIVCMVVNQQFRRMGIGKQLMAEAETFIIENGGKTIILNSGNRTEREDAHKFYLDFGYTLKSSGFVKRLV